MILLPKENQEGRYLLRLKREEDLWFVIIYSDKEGLRNMLSMETMSAVTMDVAGLERLSQEIKGAIEKKNQTKYRLSLELVDNKPDFRCEIRYIPERGHDKTGRKLDAVFSLSAGVNNLHLVEKEKDEELQYVYEDGGMHRMIGMCFSEKELLEFVQQIEKEVEKYE